MRLVLAVGLALLWAVLACNPDCHPIANHLLSGSLREFALPVSVSRLDNDRYLIANYTDVFLFDRSSGALDELTVDMGHEFDSEFVPTAIAVREDGRRILIANYRGNSVLLAEVDAGKKTLTVRGRLGDKSTLSPEGVAPPPAIYIAVANDDGGSVQVFDASQPDAARCAAPPPYGARYSDHGRLDLCELASGAKHREDRSVDMCGGREDGVERMGAGTVPLADGSIAMGRAPDRGERRAYRPDLGP